MGGILKHSAVLAGVIASVLILAGCAHMAPKTATADELSSWPDGASPREVGERVATNFLARGHMLTPQDGTIHYSEACAWYGALTFARLVGDTNLTGQLIQRFDPLFDPANSK